MLLALWLSVGVRVCICVAVCVCLSIRGIDMKALTDVVDVYDGVISLMLGGNLFKVVLCGVVGDKIS